MGCNCKCTCQPNEISFWWMNDNHTFIRLKGANLKQIVKHAEKIRKQYSCGMLCSATLLNDGKDLRRVGICIHDGKNWSTDLKKWIDAISSDAQAMGLIATGKIKGDS